MYRVKRYDSGPKGKDAATQIMISPVTVPFQVRERHIPKKTLSLPEVGHEEWM